MTIRHVYDLAQQKYDTSYDEVFTQLERRALDRGIGRAAFESLFYAAVQCSSIDRPLEELGKAVGLEIAHMRPAVRHGSTNQRLSRSVE